VANLGSWLGRATDFSGGRLFPFRFVLIFLA
jgi:hypothetical protein